MSNKGEKAGISSFDFFCIGFGAIVGVGWAVSVNKWMVNSGGALPASIGYVLALIMMVPIALCYCELAPMMPVAGGGMAYAYRAFNEKIAFISGWAAFGAFVTIIPWEAIYVVDILSILFPAIKGQVLYTLAGADIYLGNIILGTAFSLLLYAVNFKGATTSAMMQRMLTIFLVAAGLLAILAAFGKWDIANLQPYYGMAPIVEAGEKSVTHSGFMGGALAILATAPFFLAGFETIPQAVEDAAGDIAGVGKQVVFAVSLACIFYAILLFALGGALPWKEFTLLENPAGSNLFKVVYEGGVGQGLYLFILIGAIAGLFTTWNGFMMATPRLLMGMARGSIVPKFFAKQHPVHGTPTNALNACIILSIMGPFLGYGLIDPLTSFAAAGFVLSWLITSFCVVRLRKTEPDAERPYKIPGGAATAMFAGIVSLVVFILLLLPIDANPVYMGDQATIIFLCWMALGFLLYFATAGERNSIPEEERVAAMFATKK